MQLTVTVYTAYCFAFHCQEGRCMGFYYSAWKRPFAPLFPLVQAKIRREGAAHVDPEPLQHHAPSHTAWTRDDQRKTTQLSGSSVPLAQLKALCSVPDLPERQCLKSCRWARSTIAIGGPGNLPSFSPSFL